MTGKVIFLKGFRGSCRGSCDFCVIFRLIDEDIITVHMEASVCLSLTVFAYLFMAWLKVNSTSMDGNREIVNLHLHKRVSDNIITLMN